MKHNMIKNLFSKPGVETKEEATENPSVQPKNLFLDELPYCMLVGEKTEITKGIFRRVPIVMNMESLILEDSRVEFEPHHIGDIFLRKYLYYGEPGDLIRKFNQSSISTAMRELLKSADALTIIYFHDGREKDYIHPIHNGIPQVCCTSHRVVMLIGGILTMV